MQPFGSFHVKSSTPFNPPSQKWLEFDVQDLSKVLSNHNKFYFVRTGTFWDIGQWILLIKSHFLPTWRLTTSLVVSKLEYLQTHKSLWAENLHSDRFWYGQSEKHTMYRNVTFESYNCNMLPYLWNVRIYLRCC